MVDLSSFRYHSDNILTDVRKGLIAKKSQTNHGYLVGNILNKINHPNLVRTIAYVDDYHIMELAPGRPYSNIQKSMTKDEKRLVTLQSIMAIADIQNYIKFTHYDLHLGNIMVNRTNIITRYKYKCYGVNYEILSPFEIKFIDYDMSYVEGLHDDWIYITFQSLINGVVPNVYDDFCDIATIISMHMLIGGDSIPLIFNILKMNGFNANPNNLFLPGREHNPEWKEITYSYSNLFIMDRYYNNNNIIKRTLSQFTIDTFRDVGELLGNKIDYFTKSGAISNSKFISNSFKEDARWNITEIMLAVTYDATVTKIRKDFAAVMKYNKLQRIAKRTITAYELFGIIVSHLQT